MCPQPKLEEEESKSKPSSNMAQEGGGELNWQQQELMNKAGPKAGRCDWGDSEAPCDAPRDNQSAVPLAHISLSLGFLGCGGGGKGGRDNRGGGGRGGGGGGSWGAKEEGIKLYVGNLSWQTTVLPFLNHRT